MYCYKCGKVIPDDALHCPYCGVEVKSEPASQAQAPAPAATETPVADPTQSPNSRLLATLLCYFFGIIGVHRFYVGRTGSGIAMIFTIGGLGIWALVDLIMILCGKFKDENGLYLKNWDIN